MTLTHESDIAYQPKIARRSDRRAAYETRLFFLCHRVKLHSRQDSDSFSHSLNAHGSSVLSPYFTPRHSLHSPLGTVLPAFAYSLKGSPPTVFLSNDVVR